MVRVARICRKTEWVTADTRTLPRLTVLIKPHRIIYDTIPQLASSSELTKVS